MCSLPTFRTAIITDVDFIGTGRGNGNAKAYLSAQEVAQMIYPEFRLETAEQTAQLIDDERDEAFAVNCDVASSNIKEMIRIYESQISMGHVGDAWNVANTSLLFFSNKVKYVKEAGVIVDGKLLLSSVPPS